MEKVEGLRGDDFDTYIDTDTAKEDAARIVAGAGFRVWEDDWYDDFTRRVIRRIEFT